MKYIGTILGVVVLVALAVTPASAHEGDRAKLRVAHFIADGPVVDISVNGEVVWEGVEPGTISSWIDIPDTEYTVEAWADGAAVMRVTGDATAHHRISVLGVGHAANESTMFEILDETDLIGDADLSGSVFRIIYNNVAGSPPVSFYEEGMFLEKNIAEGAYSAAAFPSFTWNTGMAVAGEDLDDVFFMFDDAEDDSSSGFWEPYTVYLYGMMGTYPGTMWEDYFIAGGNPYVTTNALTYLSAWDGLGLSADGGETVLTFRTLIAAFTGTGVAEMLDRESGPYTIFAPTDTAIAMVPPATLAALLADPAKLGAVMQDCLLTAPMTYDQIVAHETVTTAAGNEVPVVASEDDWTFTYNGGNALTVPYELPDGSLLYVQITPQTPPDLE